MPQPISNETALRIGLAAHLLPAIPLPDLIAGLERLSGGVLDEAALGRITVTQLKSTFGQDFDTDGDEDGERGPASADVAAFKEAVRVLWGEARDVEQLPAVVPYAPGDLPGSVRVAIASNTGQLLDGHFGSCERFLIYQVSPTALRLVDVRPTLLAETSPDRNGYRVSLLHDCRIAYVVSAGGPAAAKVIKADIHLIQLPEGGDAPEVLARLQARLAGTPPPWLARALERPVGGPP